MISMASVKTKRRSMRNGTNSVYMRVLRNEKQERKNTGKHGAKVIDTCTLATEEKFAIDMSARVG